MKHTVCALVFGLATLGSATLGFAADGGPAAKITDLAWMTGHYEGAGGPDGSIADVNWTQPKDGSIIELVRTTKAGVTTRVEMVVIQEQGGSLVLHMQRLQRMNPSSEPRIESSLVMKLIEISANKVMFEAVGESVLKRLGYRREGDKIIVTGAFPQGGQFEAPLVAK